jgi:hypothetical protein
VTHMNFDIIFERYGNKERDAYIDNTFNTLYPEGTDINDDTNIRNSEILYYPSEHAYKPIHFNRPYSLTKSLPHLNPILYANQINFKIIIQGVSDLMAAIPDTRLMLNTMPATSQAILTQFIDRVKQESVENNYRIHKIYTCLTTEQMQEVIPEGVTTYPAACDIIKMNHETFKNEHRVYDYNDINLDAVSRILIKVDDYNVIYISNAYNHTTHPYRPRTSQALNYNGEYTVDDTILAALLPVFFEPIKNKLTPQEQEVFKYMSDYARYRVPRLVALYSNAIAAPKYLDVLKLAQQQEVKRFFIQKNNAEEEAILRLQSDIENLFQRAHDRIIQLEQARVIANNHFYNDDNFVSEFESYIFNHPYIKHYTLNGSNLRLQGVVPLTVWDTEIAETVFGNIDRHGLSEFKKKCALLFYKHVLKEQDVTYQIHVNFNLNSDFKASISSYNADHLKIGKLYNAGVNPHIAYHGCIGEYRAQLSEAHKQNDTIGTLEVALNTFKSFNLADGTVVSRFLTDVLPSLYEYDIACFKRDDVYLTLKQLEEEDNNE